MKWLGQHIVDFIARFRSDVYLEDLTTTTETNVLVVNSRGLISKSTSVGDITAVSAGTGMLGGGITGDVVLNVIGGDGITANADDIKVTPAQTTITSVLNSGLSIGSSGDMKFDFTDDGQIKVNIEGATQFTFNQGNITPQVTNTIDLGNGTYEFKDAYFDGTVTTDGLALPTTTITDILDEDAMGTNSATALATQQSIKAYVDAVPVKAYFTFRGYGTSSEDGSGDAIYEMPDDFSTTNKSPFEHDTTTGTDGLTAQTPKTFIKAGAFVMPYSGEIRKFTGWATSAGTGTVDIGLFKATLTDDSATTVTPALLVNTDITASGNNDPRNFTEASLSAAFSAGDVIYSAVKGSVDNKAWFLGSTLEVEWD